MRKQGSVQILTLLTVVLLLLSGCGSQTETQQEGVLSQFSTVDLEGNSVDQSMLEEYDLILVNVWATFCSPCKEEMPDLSQLAQQYADRGVAVIGLVADTVDQTGAIVESQRELAAEIAETYGADYTHLLPSQDLLPLVAQIQSVPTTFFVDRQGKQVGSAYLGMRTLEQWSAILDDMLGEAPQ